MIALTMQQCSKRPYASRREAEVDVSTHDVWSPRCDKCVAGLIFEAYRCLHDPTHWHIGHGEPHEWEEGERMVLMSVTDTPDAKTAPLRGGDRWCAVSAGGKGQPVEILTVNEVNVYFRATGRGADTSQKFKLPHDAFRTRYAPLRLADDRQKRMALAERSSPASSPAPIVMPEPVPDDPISEAVEAVAAEQAAASIAPVPSPWEALRPKHMIPGREYKLTAEQVREVWQLYQDGTSPKEIARTYGITGPTVVNIGKGRTYGWATADLRAAEQSEPSSSVNIAVPEPAQQPKEEPAVQIVKPPTVMETPAVERQIRAIVPAIPLIADMADALEMLLDIQAGKPLPRFVKPDLDAIRGLVGQARGAAI